MSFSFNNRWMSTREKKRENDRQTRPYLWRIRPNIRSWIEKALCIVDVRTVSYEFFEFVTRALPSDLISNERLIGRLNERRARREIDRQSEWQKGEIPACMLDQGRSKINASLLQDRLEKATAWWSDSDPSNAVAASVFSVDHNSLQNTVKIKQEQMTELSSKQPVSPKPNIDRCYCKSSSQSPCLLFDRTHPAMKVFSQTR